MPYFKTLYISVFKLYACKLAYTDIYLKNSIIVNIPIYNNAVGVCFDEYPGIVRLGRPAS